MLPQHLELGIPLHSSGLFDLFSLCFFSEIDAEQLPFLISVCYRILSTESIKRYLTLSIPENQVLECLTLDSGL